MTEQYPATIERGGIFARESWMIEIKRLTDGDPMRFEVVAREENHHVEKSGLKWQHPASHVRVSDGLFRQYRPRADS